MASVTFPPALGGDGSTVTDDANPSTGLANGGHRTRFVPSLAQTVAMSQTAVTKAGEAAASAATALAAPGTSATSTTSLAIGLGSKSLTVQTGKSFVVGMNLMIASTTTPDTQYMHAIITSYNAGTGALVVTVDYIVGTGTLANWTVSITGPLKIELPSQSGNANKFLQTNGTTPIWALPIPDQTGNSGKYLTTNGLAASWGTITAGDHEVYVNSGNGLGSVNTYVRRFTTTVRNVGTAITYADSATLGASFTINETGLYSVYYADQMSGGSNRCCVGINTSPTAAAGTVFATPSALAGDFLFTNIGVSTFSSRVVRLTAGDVLRPYNSYTTNSFGEASFIIRKVGV